MLFEKAKRGQLSSGLHSESAMWATLTYDFILSESTMWAPLTPCSQGPKRCVRKQHPSLQKRCLHLPCLTPQFFQSPVLAIWVKLFFLLVLSRLSSKTKLSPTLPAHPSHVIHTYHTHSHIIHTHHTHREVRQVYWLETVCYRPKVYKTSGKVPWVNALARGPLAKHKGKEGPDDGRNMGAAPSARAKDPI